MARVSKLQRVFQLQGIMQYGQERKNKRCLGPEMFFDSCKSLLSMPQPNHDIINGGAHWRLALIRLVDGVHPPF